MHPRTVQFVGAVVVQWILCQWFPTYKLPSRVTGIINLRVGSKNSLYYYENLMEAA